MIVARSFASPLRAIGQRRVIPAAIRFNSSMPAPHPNRDPIFDEHEHAKAHAVKSTQLWRRLSFYGALPFCFVLGVYIYQIEASHKAHADHEYALHGGIPEDQIQNYEYLRMRKKAFPWGQQCFFFNPKVNVPAEEM